MAQFGHQPVGKVRQFFGNPFVEPRGLETVNDGVANRKCALRCVDVQYRNASCRTKSIHWRNRSLRLVCCETGRPRMTNSNGCTVSLYFEESEIGGCPTCRVGPAVVCSYFTGSGKERPMPEGRPWRGTASLSITSGSHRLWLSSCTTTCDLAPMPPRKGIKRRPPWLRRNRGLTMPQPFTGDCPNFRGR